MYVYNTIAHGILLQGLKVEEEKEEVNLVSSI